MCDFVRVRGTYSSDTSGTLHFTSIRIKCNVRPILSDILNEHLWYGGLTCREFNLRYVRPFQIFTNWPFLGAWCIRKTVQWLYWLYSFKMWSMKRNWLSYWGDDYSREIFLRNQAEYPEPSHFNLFPSTLNLIPALTNHYHRNILPLISAKFYPSNINYLTASNCHPLGSYTRVNRHTYN